MPQKPPGPTGKARYDISMGTILNTGIIDLPLLIGCFLECVFSILLYFFDFAVIDQMKTRFKRLTSQTLPVKETFKNKR